MSRVDSSRLLVLIGGKPSRRILASIVLYSLIRVWKPLPIPHYKEVHVTVKGGVFIHQVTDWRTPRAPIMSRLSLLVMLLWSILSTSKAFPNMIRVINLLCVFPETNAMVERCFSTITKVKTIGCVSYQWMMTPNSVPGCQHLLFHLHQIRQLHRLSTTKLTIHSFSSVLLQVSMLVVHHQPGP